MCKQVGARGTAAPYSRSPLKVQVMGRSDSCLLAFTPGKTGDVRVKELLCVPVLCPSPNFRSSYSSPRRVEVLRGPPAWRSLKDENTQGFCCFGLVTYLYLNPSQTIKKENTRLHSCYLLCKLLLLVMVRSDVLHKAKK